MSSEITVAQVQQYSSNVFHLSQQMGSRLRRGCRIESQRGKTAYYDRIGAVTATRKTTRHADTPQIDTPHSRRAVSLNDYAHADLVDSTDLIRTLLDPASEYLKSFAMAFGRAMDDEIIAAAVGTAYGGETGSSTVVLPSTQKIVAVDGGAGSNFNVATLRLLKKKFDSNNVDPSLKRYLAVTSSQVYALLGETELTSSDFNTVRSLVNGEITQFMGFEFIMLERLLTQSGTLAFDASAGTVGSGAGDANGYRRCFAWAEGGLLFAVGQDYKGRIDERADKNYSMQAFAEMSVGATRMEEEKVVEILCNES